MSKPGVLKLTAFTALVIISSASAVRGDVPEVQFDVLPMVVCHDVTDEAFSAAHPDEKMIRAEFEVSSFLVGGSAEQLRGYFFRIRSPHASLLLHDYEPKTTLASDYAGAISVEKKKESNRQAGISLNGAWNHVVNLSGAADKGSKESENVRFELHPPQEAVTASGTIERGHGVYFRLRPSRQNVLEGAHPFALTFRVPATWRGDYLHVHTSADATEPTLFQKQGETVRCGSRDFFVALCLAGDVEAKYHAEAMVRAEASFQKAVRSYREVVIPEKRPSVIEQFIGAWDVPPKAQSDYRRQIENLVFHRVAPTREAVQNGVPQPLQGSLAKYLQTRLVMQRLAR